MACLQYFQACAKMYWFIYLLLVFISGATDFWSKLF